MLRGHLSGAAGGPEDRLMVVEDDLLLPPATGTTRAHPVVLMVPEVELKEVPPGPPRYGLPTPVVVVAIVVVGARYC